VLQARPAQTASKGVGNDEDPRALDVGALSVKSLAVGGNRPSHRMDREVEQAQVERGRFRISPELGVQRA
jgi:hypothetical protein